MKGKNIIKLYVSVVVYFVFVITSMFIVYTCFGSANISTSNHLNAQQLKAAKISSSIAIPVFNPQTNVDKSKVDPSKPMVALTFDDGPAYYFNNKNTTMQILHVLEKYNARATFFMCASRICDDNEVCLKKELELGCELGNHTYDHKHYGKKITKSDIKKGSDTIKESCGSYPTAFRCPGGIITKKIQTECKKENMPIFYWSVDTEDWKSKDADKIYKKAVKGAYDGAIILMHDIYPETAKAVKKIVPKLIKEGYQIVTVSELVEVKSGKPAKAGQQYVDGTTINNKTK